jgi:hypothetical protein
MFRGINTLTFFLIQGYYLNSSNKSFFLREDTYDKLSSDVIYCLRFMYLVISFKFIQYL